MKKSKRILSGALLSGSSAVWRCGKMGFLVFAVQLALALVLVFPLHAKWSDLLGHSRMGEEIMKGFGSQFLFRIYLASDGPRFSGNAAGHPVQHCLSRPYDLL